MSELGNKSKYNLEAAELLIAQNLHAPSVHCAYYSSLQKMSDILIEEFAYSTTELITSSKKLDQGSHEFIANEVFKNIAATNRNSSENQFIKRLFGDFKRKRIDADYTNIVIDSSKSSAALDIAIKINSTLAKIFEGDKK